MTRTRQSNGGLPVITFMHLVSGSDLIDKGMNVGLSFVGAAPDLGCFESGSGARMSTSEAPAEAEEAIAPEEQISRITISASPSQSSFIVTAPDPFEYTIYDAAGTATEKGQAQGAANVGHNLQSGLYIMKVRTAKESKTLKVLKK